MQLITEIDKWFHYNVSETGTLYALNGVVFLNGILSVLLSGSLAFT